MANDEAQQALVKITNMAPALIADEAKGLFTTGVTFSPTLEQLCNPQLLAALKAKIGGDLGRCYQIKVTNELTKKECGDLIRNVYEFEKGFDAVRLGLRAAYLEKINGAYQPVVNEIAEAKQAAMAARDEYEDRIEAEDRQRRREAAERAAAERAELARRQKIQDAAVARGQQAQTEIPDPETVVEEKVSLDPRLAGDSRLHYRLKSRVTDVDQLPEGLWVRQPNLSAIKERVLEIERTYDKADKGSEEIKQTIPGLELYWERVHRNR